MQDSKISLSNISWLVLFWVGKQCLQNYQKKQNVKRDYSTSKRNFYSFVLKTTLYSLRYLKDLDSKRREARSKWIYLANSKQKNLFIRSCVLELYLLRLNKSDQRLHTCGSWRQKCLHSNLHEIVNLFFFATITIALSVVSILSSWPFCFIFCYYLQFFLVFTSTAIKNVMDKR